MQLIYLCGLDLVPMHAKTLALFLLISLAASKMDSQISITSANLPNADDTLITQPATLLVDVNLEDTGENFTWDFGPEVLSIQPTWTSLPCYDVNETPLAYQFLFNNPFIYPDHNSEYGLGAESFQLATVSFEDTYMYYKNSGGKYSMTGMGASINGIPLAAQKIDPELIFNTPLDFSDADSSYSEMEFTVPGFGFYGQNVNRSYLCDGWGSLSIGGSSYEVLRVRTEISGTDSLYSETFSFGLMIPRPATIEYAWYSAAFKVPVLQITTTDGIVSNVVTAPLIAPSGVDEYSADHPFYPNPADNQLTLRNNSHQYWVLDQTGKLVYKTSQANHSNIDCSDWPEGLYLLFDVTDGSSNKIIVAH